MTNLEQLKRHLRAFDNGNRNVSTIKALRKAGWIEPDRNNSNDGAWRISELGLYYYQSLS
jgi:hypothetical protein